MSLVHHSLVILYDRSFGPTLRSMTTTRPTERELQDAVYFWNADQENGEFSQWYPPTMTIEGREYATAEHYMMASKAALFGDKEIEAKIRASTSPEEVRDLGRQIRHFDGQVWNMHKVDIVRTGNRHKFADPALRRVMLATGERLMVEASPVDRIWGVGFDRDQAPLCYDEWGQNLMGHVMMRIREECRDDRKG